MKSNIIYNLINKSFSSVVWSQYFIRCITKVYNIFKPDPYKLKIMLSGHKPNQLNIKIQFSCSFLAHRNIVIMSITMIQVILCEINILCHQLSQNMTTDFFRSTKIYTNCSEIQNLQFLCFEFQNNLCKSSKIWQNMLIWQRTFWYFYEEWEEDKSYLPNNFTNSLFSFLTNFNPLCPR